ncbi:MAG TPA: hypothetical protein VF527_04065 [Pyrinomonadaceae bacterium]
MRTKFFQAIKGMALTLACGALLGVPTEAFQGKGKGQQKRTVPEVIRVDSTPGVPTSARGRGRNTSPGTRRGRYIRSITRTNTNMRNPNPGTPRRRRVRRGHSNH